MGRYTGPKAKIARREGMNIFALSNNIIYSGAIPKTGDIIIVAGAENNRFPVDYSNNIVVFDYGNSIYYKYYCKTVNNISTYLISLYNKAALLLLKILF